MEMEFIIRTKRTPKISIQRKLVLRHTKMGAFSFTHTKYNHQITFSDNAGAVRCHIELHNSTYFFFSVCCLSILSHFPFVVRLCNTFEYIKWRSQLAKRTSGAQCKILGPKLQVTKHNFRSLLIEYWAARMKETGASVWCAWMADNSGYHS